MIYPWGDLFKFLGHDLRRRSRICRPRANPVGAHLPTAPTHLQVARIPPIQDVEPLSIPITKETVWHWSLTSFLLSHLQIAVNETV